MTLHTRGLTAALSVLGLFALSACGGDSDASDDGQVELRFSWWGSELRNANTQAIIDEFEAEHPDITISGEFNDWSGYLDQLATQIAGGNGPDIVQLDDEFVREYADRGALLALEDVDTSQIDPTVVESGQVEGEQYAVTTGVNALVMMANPDIFEEAGVDIPDDATWTWDDFKEISTTIHEETGVYGTNNPILQAARVWARQNDTHLFSEDGQLALSQDELEEWFSFLQELGEAKALPSPSEMVEEESAVQENSLIATGGSAMGISWTNQLAGLSAAAGTDLVPLRFPSESGSAEDNGLWFKNTMLLGVNAQTDHPDEAQIFVDYFINSTEAGLNNMMDRGLPASQPVRDAVIEDVEGLDLVVADLLTDLESEITTAEPMLPAGFSGVSDSYTNYLQEIFFGRTTPAEAAEGLVRDAENILGER